MKRLMTLLLALVMLLGMTSFAEDEARPVVTALIATSQLPAETNTILTELCERTGIDFRPTMVENTSYSQKYNTLAAAGTLPDIVAFSGYSQAMELIEHGVLLPLNDLLEEYGQEIIANHGSLLYDNLAVVDGKVYGLINGGGRYNMLMVRQDWLDALGLDVPTTTDEFLEVLRAFTFDDPDGDGEADTLGDDAVHGYDDLRAVRLRRALRQTRAGRRTGGSVLHASQLPAGDRVLPHHVSGGSDGARLHNHPEHELP